MANPNIVAVSSILGKTVANSLTTTNNTTLVSNGITSNTIIKINSVIVSNVDGTNAVNVSVFHNNAAGGAGTNFELASTISVPANASLIVVDKSTSIYLEENTSLTVTAGTASKLKTIVSYEIIS